jgi:dUTP pyrophosphatase
VISPRVLIKRLPHGQGLALPSYMSELAAGMDLAAAVERSLVIRAGSIALIPTGLAMAIPEGFEGQVRPRSGLASRYGVTVANAPGTIDADYRGEIKVALINLGRQDFSVARGDRVAQLVICPVARAELAEVEDLPSSARGEGGFGHTG